MCEYCKKTEDGNHPIMFEVGEGKELKDKISIIYNEKIFALRYKNKYEKLSEVAKINYCPMCGRELKEEQRNGSGNLLIDGRNAACVRRRNYGRR